MDRTGEIREAVNSTSESAFPSITWETHETSTPGATRDFDPHAIARGGLSDLNHHEPGRTDDIGVPGTAPGVRRFANRLCAALSRPTFRQIHGRSPMETTCIVRATMADAADVLGRLIEVEWGRGRNAGRLSIEPFQGVPTELGRPWVADAVLDAYGIRRLRVTVAIFRYGNDRCGIQVRPGIRRPRSSRRLRHCLRSTHGAADRLRELVLAVDFTPPGHAAIAGIPARERAV